MRYLADAGAVGIIREKVPTTPRSSPGGDSRVPHEALRSLWRVAMSPSGSPNPLARRLLEARSGNFPSLRFLRGTER